MDNYETIHKYLDGQLSEQEMQSFAAWLREDPERLDQMMSAGTMELELYEIMRRNLFQEDMVDSYFSEQCIQDFDLADTAAGPRSQTKQSQLLDNTGTLLRTRFKRLPLKLSIAAALAITAGTVFLLLIKDRSSGLMNRGFDSSQSIADLGIANQDNVVARLTHASGCQWKEGSEIREVGSDLLEEDRITLTAGTIRATFENGTRVTIEGPCDFRFDDEMTGMLFYGRLAADVPEEAIGFSIQTPSTEIVDLGTAFGVEVDQHGESEVHVFEGEVVAHHLTLNREQQHAVLRLKKNDAARYGDDGQPNRILADPTRFVRDVDTRLPVEKVPDLPVLEDLALWLAADQLVQLDQDQHVQIWGDILAGDNQSAEDAYQLLEECRPAFSPEGINGLPAISFDGTTDYFTTSPLKTTNDQTIVFVAAFSRDLLTRGQLINYNGPPYRRISKLSDPGILQIDAPLTIPASQPTRPILAGRVFFRKGDKDPVPVGTTDWKLPAADYLVPVIGAYRYDTINDQATLWVNGEVVSESSAPWPAAITSRKVIGRHGKFRWHFHGKLAEMMIYNAAVSDADLTALCKYLSLRYSIALHPNSGDNMQVKSASHSL